MLQLQLTGLKFGQLTVVADSGLSNSFGQAIWICSCGCGQMVNVVGCNLKSGNTKSCGCLKRNKRKKARGKFAPNWRGGTKRRAMSVAHLIWRKQVLQRCNYTCDISGQVGGILEAHHLNGWAWFPDQRFDVENGVTLSLREHILFHEWMGGIAVKCTKEDYETYKPLRIRESMIFGM